MKITGHLFALIEDTRAQLAALGNNCRLSQRLTIQEAFGDKVLELLGKAGDEITDQEKIAAFNVLLHMRVGVLKDQVERTLKGGEYWRDDDDDHYCYEEVVTAVFGENIFDALNQMENLLPKKAR